MKASTGHNGSLADALIAARRRCVRGCVGAWVRGCLRVRVRVCATCGEHTPYTCSCADYARGACPVPRRAQFTSFVRRNAVAAGVTAAAIAGVAAFSLSSAPAKSQGDGAMRSA